MNTDSNTFLGRENRSPNQCRSHPGRNSLSTDVFICVHLWLPPIIGSVVELHRHG
jgi:hypothetical protein